MKNSGYIRLLVCVLLVGLAAASASAQSMKVNVPFDFRIGDTALAAGIYSVEQATSHTNPNVLLLRSADRSIRKLSMGIRVEKVGAVQQPSLVFHKYGNRYFLSQVWLNAGNAGTEIRKGNLERELAMGGSSPEIATVIAEAR